MVVGKSIVAMMGEDHLNAPKSYIVGDYGRPFRSSSGGRWLVLRFHIRYTLVLAEENRLNWGGKVSNSVALSSNFSYNSIKSLLSSS
jgi:hypothetical protein